MFHATLTIFFCSISRSLKNVTWSEVQLMCVSDREREGDRENHSLTISYGLFPEYPFLIHPQSCSPGTDQNGSPEVSSISSPLSLLSLALSPLSASLQQTFSLLLLPFSCSPFFSQQSPFLSRAALISSALSTSSLFPPLSFLPFPK